MTLLKRRPKTKADLKRRPGRGLGSRGTACPETSRFAPPVVKDVPVSIDELAFLHRHVGPRGNQRNMCRFDGRRQYGEMRFGVRFAYGVMDVSRPAWSVRFSATGSPDGWCYRFGAFHGEVAVMRAEIAWIATEIERVEELMRNAETTHPFTLRFTNPTASKKALRWCRDRYGEDFLRHKGVFRFRRAELAFECKMNWC